MIELQTLLIFLTACLVINITPGPSILYVSTVTISQGTRAGVLASFGLSLGIFLHVIATALGISIILANSATVFIVLKYAGAAYLAYLGLRTLIRQTSEQINKKTQTTKQNPLKTLLQGAMIDVLNPKLAIFFLALFPQFVDSNNSSATVQIFILGLVFITTGTAINCIFAVLIGRSAHNSSLVSHSFFTRWLPGCVLLVLSARMFTLER